MAVVAPSDLLRAELERLFDLEALQRLARDLLGLDPDDVAAGANRGAYARALAERSLKEDMHEALADAIVFADRDAEARLRPVYEGRPAEDLAPGTMVAGCKITKKLHDEGFGTVYQATSGDGKPLTLKVLREGRVRDRRGLQRFLTAQRALRDVQHPAVQRIVSAGVLPDGRPYLIAEHIDGQLLSARLGRTGPMHVNEAKTFLGALCEGLDKVHAAGLAHADIRPDHVVLVRREGTLSGVLVDFGLDRLGGVRPGALDQASLFVLLGSARTLSPERARGTSGADARSDVYALGALTYEVLTGKPVFSGATAMDTLVAHIVQTPEPPSKLAPRGWVSKDVDAVVLQSLAKEPEHRYASAGGFFHALMDALRGKKAAELTPEEFTARKTALAEAPGDEERAQALEASGTHGVLWTEVALGLREVGDGCEDEAAKKALRFRLARVLEAEVKDLKAAREVYEALAAGEGGDPVARARSQELRRALATPEERAEILLEDADAETQPTAKARAYGELAKLYERELKDPEGALHAYTLALTETPSDGDLVTEIERLGGEDKTRWGEVLQSVAGAVQGREPGDAVALLLVVARWYQEKVQRSDFALGCYTQALTLVPGQDAALEGAAGIYRKAQQWPELAAALVKRADAQKDGARAQALRAEAADLYDARLSDRARARELCEKVLAEDPSQPKAVEVLERILLGLQDHKGLVALLERKAGALQGEARAEALNELAEVYEDRIEDPVKAAEFFEQAREADGRNVATLKGLERLYARSGDHEKLLRCLEAQVSVAATPRQKVELNLRVGAMYEEEFVDHGKAAAAYEAALALDPAHDAAMAGLGRLYKVLGRWSDLAELLEKHQNMVEDTRRKVDLLLAQGRVLLDPLGANERAARAFERVLELDKGNTAALESVGRIAAQRGDVKAAAEAWEQLAAASKGPEVKAELVLRIAKLFEEKGDRDGALERYKQALDLQPDNTVATARLRELYASRGDAGGAIEMLQREIENTEGSNQRAALWTEVARVYRDRVKDRDKARDAARKAVLLDGTHAEASAFLGEILFDDGDFGEAAKLLAARAGHAKELPKDEGLHLVLRYGEALARSGDGVRALDAFRVARDIAPEDREALQRVAHATFQAGVYTEAKSLYEDLLRRYGAELEPGPKLEALLELAEASQKTADLPAAVKASHDALELDARSVKALDLACAAHGEEGRWDEVVRYKRRRVELASTDEERYAQNLELAELLSQRLADRAGAARALVAASEVRKDDRKILMRLMGLYSEEKDWSRLVEVILRLADKVEDRAQLAKYYFTAAQLSDLHLSRAEEALDYYEMALENDPAMAGALEGLAQLRTRTSDFEGLEKSYKKLLGRLPEKAPSRAALHARLAELYETKLKQPAEAIAEYERAAALDPAGQDHAEKLAALYVTDTKRYHDKVLLAHRGLLLRDPVRAPSLHALRRVYTEARRPDEAWCLCQALVSAKAAEPEEENFFKKFRTERPAVAQEKLTDERWVKELAHPSQDALVTAVFAAIQPAVLAARAVAPGEYGLSDATRIDPATDSGQMAQTLHYASGVLGLKAPPVHVLSSDPAGLSFAHLETPALFLGQTALAGGPPKALAFIAGARLSYFRPGHYLRQLVPTGTGLRAWLFAAIRVVQPTFPVSSDIDGPVEENTRALKGKLSGGGLELLASLVGKIVQGGASLDLKRWTLGVDLTADRAGFLLANDLAMALAVIRATPDGQASAPQAERTRELRLFAVSEEYFRLRENLGIAIKAGGPSAANAEGAPAT
ncbi:MAG: tetratricopeptide repeat protein [Deltaproteobacteria bacterium]|nr:tetratricopeptide repeat protein [Deltaproteobacteria bacterium]